MVPAAALGTPTQPGGNFMVSVAGTATGSIPHQIDLKVTQLPGGQLSEVSGFVVSPADVVQIKQDENLIVSTSPDLQTHQVTVTNMQGIPIDLVPLPSSVWSLQGLLPGVYTLDVVVVMSSSGILGTYETILVILEPNQQPLSPTTIISQITIEETAECPTNLVLINENCTEPPTPPSPTPNPTPTDYCYLPGVGDWWDNPDCREYLENKNSRRPVCTPDGPECPPCPEGVEAGWCADEDERGDFDCGDEGMENDPRCIDRNPPVDGYVCDDSDECSKGGSGPGGAGGIPIGDCEDTGGLDPCGEEEDQNCGGEPCTDDEKEDSTIDESEETEDQEDEEEEIESNPEEGEVIE
jgi:hypothetical protein